MEPTLRILETISIQEPCALRWEELAGDERKRFCGQCSQHVHNFSALRADEAARLVAGSAAGGRLCVTYVPGPDGKPWTLPERSLAEPERSTGRRRWRSRLRQSGLGFLALLASCTPGAKRAPKPLAPSEDPPPAASAPADTPAEPRLLGEIAICPPREPLMGKVALPPPAIEGAE